MYNLDWYNSVNWEIDLLKIGIMEEKAKENTAYNSKNSYSVSITEIKDLSNYQRQAKLAVSGFIDHDYFISNGACFGLGYRKSVLSSLSLQISAVSGMTGGEYFSWQQDMYIASSKDTYKNPQQTGSDILTLAGEFAIISAQFAINFIPVVGAFLDVVNYYDDIGSLIDKYSGTKMTPYEASTSGYASNGPVKASLDMIDQLNGIYNAKDARYTNYFGSVIVTYNKQQNPFTISIDPKVGVEIWDFNSFCETRKYTEIELSDPLTIELAGGINRAPNTPPTATGPSSVYRNRNAQFGFTGTDPDFHKVKLEVNWGDGTTSTTDWIDSGTTKYLTKSYSSYGTKYIKYRVIDSYGSTSAWSSSKKVNIIDRYFF